MTKHAYGYIPDHRDHRDHLYAAPFDVLQTLPPSVDLRPRCPSIYNQGQLGSCTANAIAGAMEFDQKKQNLPDFIPSRLFIYYNERAMEGTVDSDSGAMIRDGVKSVNNLGVCPESEWPYDISQFTDKPSTQSYHDALNCKALQYSRVARSLNQMKGCLAAGSPFVFGISVYESFESSQVASTGVVPMPARSEQLLGGHAILCVGYDDGQQRFIARNSWGTGWGQNGYFTIPYLYLMNSGLSSDFWVIKVIS